MSGIIGQGSKSGVIGAKDSTSNISDYEEGIYTPVVRGSTSGTLGLGTSDGKYTKIGNLVSFSGYVNPTSGSFIGYLEITLPFVIEAGAGSSEETVVNVVWRNHGGAWDSYGGIVQGGTNQDFRFYHVNADAETHVYPIDNGSVDALWDMWFSGHYYTSA